LSAEKKVEDVGEAIEALAQELSNIHRQGFFEHFWERHPDCGAGDEQTWEQRGQSDRAGWRTVARYVIERGAAPNGVLEGQPVPGGAVRP